MGQMVLAELPCQLEERFETGRQLSTTTVSKDCPVHTIHGIPRYRLT